MTGWKLILGKAELACADFSLGPQESLHACRIRGSLSRLFWIRSRADTISVAVNMAAIVIAMQEKKFSMRLLSSFM